MMTEREKLLRKIQTSKFVMWELHIFLDTHPNNREVIMRYENEKKKCEKLMEEYENKYGPIKEPKNETNRFSWISSPWPWENEEVCD